MKPFLVLLALLLTFGCANGVRGANGQHQAYPCTMYHGIKQISAGGFGHSSLVLCNDGVIEPLIEDGTRSDLFDVYEPVIQDPAHKP